MGWVRAYCSGVAYLTVRIKGEEGHTRQDLDQDRMVLGRTSESDITIKSDGISREHCVFTKEGDQWYVEDLGSSNGTRVNADKITEKTPLNERDIIKISKARLTVHVKPRPARRATAEDSTPVHTAGANDPLQAIPCPHCCAWISIAHRLPGDSITCPRCHSNTTVPTLVQAEND